MSKLRVFHLIKSLGRGGAETLLSQGLACAHRDEFEFAYGYFLPWKKALVPELEEQGAEVRCFDGQSSPEVLAKVPQVALHLRRWKADVVHCHLPISGVCGRLAGQLARVPVIYTEHNLQERYQLATRQLNLKTWRLQKKVIAVSEEVAASARQHAGDKVPIEVVPNGVDLARFTPSAVRRAETRRALGIDAEAYVIGTCAVFRTQKRLDLWLEVAKAVSADFPTARFVLVGDGPLRPEVEEAIARLGLVEKVILPGLKGDVRGYLDAMDVFLMSSEFEGLPVAMLEAMAMETAIVATSVGGIPEVLVEESGGICVPSGDVRGLADALRLLGRAAPHRQQLGKRGRQRVEEAFSMERMQGRLEAIYREVVEGRS